MKILNFHQVNQQSLYFLTGIKKNKKNELNINPLLPWNNVNSGPKWYFYPKKFF